jgi:hypothetical protein
MEMNMTAKPQRVVGLDKDLTPIKRVITIVEISDWARNMATGKWYSPMETFMRGTGKADSSTAGEGTNGKMEQYFRAIFGSTNAKEKELSFTPTIRELRGIGETTFAMRSQFIISLRLNNPTKLSIYPEKVIV